MIKKLSIIISIILLISFSGCITSSENSRDVYLDEIEKSQDLTDETIDIADEAIDIARQFKRQRNNCLRKLDKKESNINDLSRKN